MRRLALTLLLVSSALPLAACDRGDEATEAPAARQDAMPSPIARAIETALPAPVIPPPRQTPPPTPSAPGDAQIPASPDLALVRIQILLDRSAISPGLIDGLNGENLRQAVAAWRQARGLEGGGLIDAALIQGLTAVDAAPVTARYRVTAADMAGPFSPPPGDDLKAQAAAGANFTSPLERLAERFHVSEALLIAMNPGVDLQEGVSLVVPALSTTPLPLVARIEVDKSARALRAFNSDGVLVAYYPATIGSSDNPTPSGDLTVNGVARRPDYTYDPAKLSYGPGGDRVVVPAGPNNPVGEVWIDLSRESYGIHGTPDPAKVGKTASHGCVRLTNWDARQLSEAVKPGVAVRFI